MDRQTLLSLFVSWLPFIVLILIWIGLSRWVARQQTARGGWPLVRLADQQEAQLTELQRTNALLDRIAAALERRAGN